MTCDHDLIIDGRTIRTRTKASSSSHGTGFGRADRTEPGGRSAVKPRASKPVSLFAWLFKQADRHEGQVASASPSTNSESKIH